MIKNIEINDVKLGDIDAVWVKACKEYGLENLSKSIGLTVQTLITADREQNELIKDYGSDVASKINGYATAIYGDIKNNETTVQ